MLGRLLIAFAVSFAALSPTLAGCPNSDPVYKAENGYSFWFGFRDGLAHFAGPDGSKTVDFGKRVMTDDGRLWGKDKSNGDQVEIQYFDVSKIAKRKPQMAIYHDHRLYFESCTP